jgi:hypothetical protein
VEGFHAIFIISLIGASFQEEGTSILGDLQLEGLDLLKPSKGSLLLFIHLQIYRFATYLCSLGFIFIYLWSWRSFLFRGGALSIGVLVFWRGRSFHTVWRLGIGVSHPPIYLFAVGFSGLEAISLEAEFLVTYSQ